MTLIKTALHPQIHQALIHSAAVTELENGGLNLLYQVADSFLNQQVLDQPPDKQDWRRRYFSAIAELQQHNIATVSDPAAGADDYVALREKWDAIVVALARYMDYTWQEIAPAE